MNRGTDYGMGETNIDKANGIRFGIISQNSILQSWADSSEPEYGEPHCPKCGNEAQGCSEVNDEDSEQEEIDSYTREPGECAEYVCTDCKHYFGGESAFGDEPLGYTFDDDGYNAHADSDGDVWITKSPYFTRAQFCSPCAPGACYLTNPCDEGERAYCFAADWFDDDIEPCPYPIWRVDTGEQVYTPPVPSDE